MTLEEFKEHCINFDDNIGKRLPPDKFLIECGKCGSNSVSVMLNGKEIGVGSEYTGVWTRTPMNLLFKCKVCGNAHGIIDSY